MTESFILCIAVDSPKCRPSDLETLRRNTLTFSLLSPNDRSETCAARASLRSFTLDLVTERTEPGNTILQKAETTHRVSALAELFLKAYREFCEMEDVPSQSIEGRMMRAGAASRGVRPWLEEARNILHTEFGDQPKLPEIAAKVGVHPVHLAREFRRQYGFSVGEYLRKVRIEFACDRLLCSEDPPVMIATAAGFVDQSHFSRTFRRLLGTTPGRYRAALKSSQPL